MRSDDFLDDTFYTIRQIADILGITNQAVYSAVERRRIKLSKDKNNRFLIHSDDVREYVNTLYSRNYSTYKNGAPIYDKSKNIYSVSQLSELLNIETPQIYTAIYNDIIPFKRFKTQYLITCKNPSEMRKAILKKQKYIE